MDSEKILAIVCAPIAAMLFVKARAKWWAYQDERYRKKAEQTSWTTASLIVPLVAHDPEASSGDVGSDGLSASAATLGHQELSEPITVTHGANATPSGEAGDRL